MTIKNPTAEQEAQLDAAAEAVANWVGNLLAEALVRYGSVDAAKGALTALMAADLEGRA